MFTCMCVFLCMPVLPCIRPLGLENSNLLSASLLFLGLRSPCTVSCVLPATPSRSNRQRPSLALCLSSSRSSASPLLSPSPLPLLPSLASRATLLRVLKVGWVTHCQRRASGTCGLMLR
mmetsp:Transcript_71144/g.141062  ORF Transcript_71144/g.141062 Transcript_71144/m.141062 type:complete len:119 (+) Transcript_71144:923-1279(+)